MTGAALHYRRLGCVHPSYCACSRTPNKDAWCDRPTECDCCEDNSDNGALRGCLESDYEPGSFYPCHVCNPGWQHWTLAECIDRKAAGR